MDNFTIPSTWAIKSTYEQIKLARYFNNITSSFTRFFVDEESVFNELVNNKTFLREAKEARREILRNPLSFTNFTQKYSNFIR